MRSRETSVTPPLSPEAWVQHRPRLWPAVAAAVIAVGHSCGQRRGSAACADGAATGLGDGAVTLVADLDRKASTPAGHRNPWGTAHRCHGLRPHHHQFPGPSRPWWRNLRARARPGRTTAPAHAAEGAAQRGSATSRSRCCTWPAGGPG